MTDGQRVQVPILEFCWPSYDIWNEKTKKRRLRVLEIQQNVELEGQAACRKIKTIKTTLEFSQLKDMSR